MAGQNPDHESQLKRAQQRLAVLDAERAALQQLIATLGRWPATSEGDAGQADQPKSAPTIVRSDMGEAEKIKLFRSFFRGREDVYALRFESKRTGRSGYSPACRNEWVQGICRKPQIKCGDCDRRELLPLTDDVIRAHLIGHDRRSGARAFVAGIYPLLFDETCWFLAADFDKEAWVEDAIAFVTTCRTQGISAALERSRSGNGAHVWIPFDTPLPAALARRLGAALLTLTMERRPEVGLDLYDRFFPNQDTMPEGQFGNLIALPFQGDAVRHGNTVFLDDELTAIPDQWKFLSTFGKASAETVRRVVDQAAADGKVFGVRLPIADENEDDPWTTPPSRRPHQRDVEGPLPATLRVVLGNEIYVEKVDLSPALRNRIIRIAAFLNPDFYSKQAMRRSTYDTPRIIGSSMNAIASRPQASNRLPAVAVPSSSLACRPR